MKSIKPGRGPSAMSALGSVIAVFFGIIWTIAAASMGAPFFFPLFGLLFIFIGVAQAIYHFKNATGENRYSSFDITEDGEEPDPLQERFAARKEERWEQTAREEPYGRSGAEAGVRFCPYCGARVQADYEFCGKCGKKLP